MALQTGTCWKCGRHGQWRRDKGDDLICCVCWQARQLVDDIGEFGSFLSMDSYWAAEGRIYVLRRRIQNALRPENAGVSWEDLEGLEAELQVDELHRVAS